MVEYIHVIYQTIANCILNTTIYILTIGRSFEVKTWPKKGWIHVPGHITARYFLMANAVEILGAVIALLTVHQPVERQTTRSGEFRHTHEQLLVVWLSHKLCDYLRVAVDNRWSEARSRDRTRCMLASKQVDGGFAEDCAVDNDDERLKKFWSGTVRSRHRLVQTNRTPSI